MIATITLNPSVDRRYNIEQLKLNSVQRTGDYQATAGGKGINVSKVVNILAEEVTAFGFLGGHSGDFLREKVEALNIKSNFTKIEGTTRTCLNIIDQEQNAIEVLENGPEISSAEKQKFLDQYKASLKNLEVIAMSGSLPKGIESDFYQKLIEIAKSAGKTVILDSSGSSFLAGLKAGPDLIKPNKSEVEAAVGFSLTEKEDFLKAGKILQQKGAKKIALSLGKDGMLYFDQETAYQVKIPEIEVLNVTGSGDSLVAGLAVGLKQNLPLEEMLKLANACGMANALEKTTGFVTKENVEKYQAQIKVKEM